MKLLLQRPLPDELLTSALVRTCVRFELPIGRLMSSLHGHRTPPGFFHLSNISAYTQALGLNEDQILKSHTVFPHLVAFQPWERRLAFRQAALLGSGGDEVRLSALQRTSLYVPYRRLCAACVKADKARFGWSYWHVSHQLPGMTRCQIHSQYLRETQIQTKSGTRYWSYALPEDTPLPAQRRPAMSGFEREIQRLTTLTQAEEFAYALGPLPTGLYRKSLEQVGLLERGKAMRANGLRQWVGDVLRRAPTCHHLLADDPQLTWVELLLRDRPGSTSPAVKHLVVLAAIACTARPDSPTLNHKPTGMRRRDTLQRDRECAQELADQFKQARRDGVPLQLPAALGAMKLWSAYRHDRSRFPNVAKVIAVNRDHLEWTRLHFSRLARQGRSLLGQAAD